MTGTGRAFICLAACLCAWSEMLASILGADEGMNGTYTPLWVMGCGGNGND